MLWLFLLMILNAAIATFNAYGAGRDWRIARGFEKLVLWAALIMSACGYLMVSAVVLGFFAASVGYINERGMQALMSLTYLMIIIPVLGAGMIITIHSWIEARKRGDFVGVGVATYNTFAQASNMYDAMDGIPSAFGNVVDFFKPNSDDELHEMAGKIAVMVVLLVAMVIAGGLTYVFFQKGQRAALVSAQSMRRSIYRMK